MTYAIPNMENITSLTGVMQTVNNIEPTYLITLWWVSYLLLLFLLSPSGMKRAFMGVSFIHIFLTALMMTMGLDKLYLFISSVLFVISLFVYYWGDNS